MLSADTANSLAIDPPLYQPRSLDPSRPSRSKQMIGFRA
jgi:hypothetical protein